MTTIKGHSLELVDTDKDIYECNNCKRRGYFSDFFDNCNNESSDDEKKEDRPKGPFKGILDFFEPTQL